MPSTHRRSSIKSAALSAALAAYDYYRFLEYRYHVTSRLKAIGRLVGNTTVIKGRHSRISFRRFAIGSLARRRPMQNYRSKPYFLGHNTPFMPARFRPKNITNITLLRFFADFARRFAELPAGLLSAQQCGRTPHFAA